MKNLRYADLDGKDLRKADLRNADLRCAHMRGADLRGADLRNANLQLADFTHANLRNADLRGAYLSQACLQNADLRGANLPAPAMVLLASWGGLSDQLTADLMEYDASLHPDRTAFDRWARGGDCPYMGRKIDRTAHFDPVRNLWGKGRRDSAYNLMVRVLKEKAKTNLSVRRKGT